MMNLEEETKLLSKWLERILESKTPIVCEGPNDAKALKNIGIHENRIITLKKAIYEHVEEIAEKTDNVIILTDFDRQGRLLYFKLSKDFEMVGVHVDKYFRKTLFKTNISHIEGIDTYIRRVLNS